jgi:hypothetical protein
MNQKRFRDEFLVGVRKEDGNKFLRLTQEEEIRQGIVNVRVSGLLPRLFRESTKIITNPAEFRLTFFIGSGEKWGVVAENVTRNLRWHE